ncbi:MAG: hypothetical protein WC464_08965 [Bdellovibrionales bacterium]
MSKKFLVGVAAFVALIGIGGYFLGSGLDSIVRIAIEKIGTAATQTAVDLDDVTLSLTSGEASLSGLSVGNPDGFKVNPSLYLGHISVKLDTQSISGTGPIVIKEVAIVKPGVAYEVGINGSSNLETLAKNAQAYAASMSGEKAKAAKADDADKKPARKIVINSMTISDGQISISHAALGGRQLTAPLPLIRLTNIGKNEGGTTPAEVAKKVLDAITKSAGQVASSSLTKELGASFNKAGEKAGTAAKEIGGQIKGLLGRD